MKSFILNKQPIAIVQNPDHELYLLTIEEYLALAPGKIDTNPKAQRIDVEASPIGAESPSKMQSIIANIFLGKYIGEIQLAKNKLGVSRFALESIDGGHRKRAIIEFVRGKFPLHKSIETDKRFEKIKHLAGKYYHQLTDEERKVFNSYVLKITVYDEMGNEEKSDAFYLANIGTPINHQERRNAQGDTYIANFIRNTAREVPGENNKPHPLFERHGDKYLSIGFPNKRLIHDELVARITYMCYSGEKLIVCGNKQLDEMYRDPKLTEEEVKKLSKKVFKCLDFLLEISKARFSFKNDKCLVLNECTLVSRLYFWYKQELAKQESDFKLIKKDVFFQEMDIAVQKFRSDDDKVAIRTLIKDNVGTRTMSEAWGRYLGCHDNQTKIENSVQWLINDAAFDPFLCGALQEIHSKRCFDRSDVEGRLAEQGYKCWITGEPLTMKNAEGGHKKSHANGGKTTLDNLIVIHKDHNRNMGQMDAEDYKIRYLEDQEKNQQPIRKVAKRK